MDIGKELGENKIVLVIIPSTKYGGASLKIAKKLSQKKLCYVTTNKTSASLNESFSKKKVKMENVIFVDAISKSLGTSSKDEQSSKYEERINEIKQTLPVIEAELKGEMVKRERVKNKK